MNDWDGMLTLESLSVNPDHAHQNWWAEQGGYGTGRWSRKAFNAGATWVIKMQLEWESLTEAVAIDELRKGEKSIFYPLFREDPRIVADCPKDGAVTVGKEGFCDACGFDFTH